MIKLPSPEYEAAYNLNRSIQYRRSMREYKDEPMTLQQAADLLWSSQGVTSLGGFRTAPSAGAVYPLEIRFVAGNVEELEAGVYKYDPQHHTLQKTADGDRRNALAKAALNQGWMARCGALIAVTAVYERATKTYGQRGVCFVYMEAGHAGQNVLLEAVSLGLGAAAVGSFDDAAVRKALELPAGEEPLYLLPVGRV
ncbi:MAG: SagB/ThcOx family dehydrogenase [Kiritimatiellae bacterium]|nr:SagB/ThcOx family dehydrogenase [Kiritimatiellia bacterium]